MSHDPVIFDIPAFQTAIRDYITHQDTTIEAIADDVNLHRHSARDALRPNRHHLSLRTATLLAHACDLNLGWFIHRPTT